MRAVSARGAYTGVSMGYGVTYGLMGGIAPLVAASLIDITGNRLSPALCVMLAGAISLVALWRTSETRDRALD